MRYLELVLCEQDASYINLFATYLMEYDPQLRIHIFTTVESFFADPGHYDLGLLGKEFLEVSSFKEQGGIDQIYYLSESLEGEDSNPFVSIYKYQSMEEIISMIPQLGLQKVKHMLNTTKKSKKHSFVTGIYSPVSHELQLPFGLALAQVVRGLGRVLFIDLEEISLLPELIGGSKDNNIMDYIYLLNADESSSPNLEDFVQPFMGIDYIPSFNNPEEINNIPAKEYKKLFERLRVEGYDQVIVLFGRSVSGFASLIEDLDQLVLLNRTGDYFKKNTEIFMNYLELMNISTDIVPITLGMSAGNLTEGAYCMEELLQGNLGLFVRKLYSDGSLNFERQADG